MMRRIDLLPVAYAQRRKDRMNVLFTFLVFGVIALVLLFWMLLLNSQINSARSELADARARNAQIQAQINELQRFADLEAEVQTKRTALQTVMASDIDWPALMTEIAMVVPGEVWLESMTVSAATTEGETPVPTEGNAIRLTRKSPSGRIQFDGHSVCMPGVAKWLIRLGTVEDFSAVWLASATEVDTRVGCEQIDFSSTLELSETAKSNRFQGELE